jgi:hypothetical protein
MRDDTINVKTILQTIKMKRLKIKAPFVFWVKKYL